MTVIIRRGIKTEKMSYVNDGFLVNYGKTGSKTAQDINVDTPSSAR